MPWRCSFPSATATATATATAATIIPRFYLNNSLTFHSHPNPIPFHLPLSSSSLRFSIPLSIQPTNSPKFSKLSCTNSDYQDSPPPQSTVDCVGTGQDVECSFTTEEEQNDDVLGLWEWVVLISPFFFWGTAMVAMKEVLPKCGPFFVSSFRLIPAGFLLVGFASSRGRPFPSGFNAWFSISLFALIDAACFQVHSITPQPTYRVHEFSKRDTLMLKYPPLGRLCDSNP